MLIRYTTAGSVSQNVAPPARSAEGSAEGDGSLRQRGCPSAETLAEGVPWPKRKSGTVPLLCSSPAAQLRPPALLGLGHPVQVNPPAPAAHERGDRPGHRVAALP